MNFKKRSVAIFLGVLLFVASIAVGGEKLISEDPPLKGLEKTIWMA